jgi:hypothetical protein
MRRRTHRPWSQCRWRRRACGWSHAAPAKRANQSYRDSPASEQDGIKILTKRKLEETEAIIRNSTKNKVKLCPVLYHSMPVQSVIGIIPGYTGGSSDCVRRRQTHRRHRRLRRPPSDGDRPRRRAEPRCDWRGSPRPERWRSTDNKTRRIKGQNTSMSETWRRRRKQKETADS